MHSELDRTGGFKCLRPTIPVGEDVFQVYSETRKTKFLNALDSILDDDPSVRTGLTRIVKAAGDFLSSDKYKEHGCIILDIHMPEMTGPELQEKQIAAEMDISEETVKIHRGRVMQKLGIVSVA